MNDYDLNDRWQEIQVLHRKHRLFYQIVWGMFMLMIGIVIGVGTSTAEDRGSILLGILVGLVTGIFTNLASWWILFHGIVPDIRFFPLISKISSSNVIDENMSGFKYRIKLENVGKRTIIDVELMARLRVKGLRKISKDNWWVVYIPLEPVMNSREYRIPQVLPTAIGKARSHIFELHINFVDEFRTSKLYPEIIRKKAEQKQLLLEDLLNLGRKATLDIATFGYDEFSGTRKLFLYQYTVNKIGRGTFKKLNKTLPPLRYLL